MNEHEETTQHGLLIERVAGAIALGILGSIFAVGAVTTALVGSVYLLFLLFP